MEPEWKKESSDPSVNTFVMPLPYLLKDYIDPDGKVCYDAGLFPEYVPLTPSGGYDISTRRPKRIYVQFPYDGQGTILYISGEYCCEALRNMTDELVYIPCFDTLAPSSTEEKHYKALMDLAEQPAVYYSDKIILKDEALKKAYVSILAGITGEDTKSYWDEKITISAIDETSSDEKKKEKLPPWLFAAEGKKILVFQVNASFICLHGEKAIHKIKESLEIMKKEGEKICCVFSPHESLDNPPFSCQKLWEEVSDSLKKDDGIIYDAAHGINDCLYLADAYYGTGGHLAHRCRLLKIPVMLMAIL